MQKIVPEHSVYYLEIVTPNVKAMCDLYTKSYGWNFQPMVPELGNACVADLPGGSLCGIRAPMHAAEKPIVRTYLRVTDIQASVQKAAQLGAKILLDHMEIPGRGIIAIYENGGIEQGLWQVQ
jgi:predicted enzyme related to lactoylglutathione lyase